MSLPLVSKSKKKHKGSYENLDTVISSRVRISRNIVGYKFPAMISPKERKKIFELVSTAGTTCNLLKKTQFDSFSNITIIRKKILEERGLLPSEMDSDENKGIFVTDDVTTSLVINCKDHLRMTSIYSGFSVDSCYATLSELEKELSSQLSFSAVKDIGYLTSNIMTIGSGLKSSVLCSFPGLDFSEKLQNEISGLAKKGFNIHGFYATDSHVLLGWLYLFSSGSAAGGSAEEQIDFFRQTINELIEKEKSERALLLKKYPLQVKDTLLRALSLVKSALLLDLKDCVDILLKIKLGINIGLIAGIDHVLCNELLYKLQTASLASLLLTENFQFTENVPTDELRIQRVRAILLQDALKNVDINLRS